MQWRPLCRQSTFGVPAPWGICLQSILRGSGDASVNGCAPSLDVTRSACTTKTVNSATDFRVKLTLYALFLVPFFAGACARSNVAQNQQPPLRVVAAETDRVLGLDTASFSGRWEFVQGRHDGRFQGASVRSFHPGDCISFIFTGGQFQVYGVSGPRGGHALVSIPGSKSRTISFYSPQKRTHALLYVSPTFSPGVHSAALVVEPSRESRSLRTYVNVDELEIVKSGEVR